MTAPFTGHVKTRAAVGVDWGWLLTTGEGWAVGGTVGAGEGLAVGTGVGWAVTRGEGLAEGLSTMLAEPATGCPGSSSPPRPCTR